MTIASHAPADSAAPTATALLASAMRLVERASQLLTDDIPGRGQPAVAQLRTAGDALRQLLSGRTEEAIVAGLGCPLAQSRLVCLRSTSVAVLDLLTERCKVERRVVIMRMTNETAAVLVPGTPRPTGVDASRRHAAVLLTSLERTVAAASWAAGISSPINMPVQVAAAWRDAVDAAIVAEDTQQPHVAAEDAWATLTVRRLRDALPSIRTLESGLDRLAEHDAGRGSDLGHTLGVWLKSNCDTRTAAAALHIHANTLRYRIARVAEVAGLDLNDAEQRLVLQLAHSSSCYQPRARHSSRCGRSSPSVVSAPCPG